LRHGTPRSLKLPREGTSRHTQFGRVSSVCVRRGSYRCLVQVADANGFRRTIIPTSENRKVVVRTRLGPPASGRSSLLPTEPRLGPAAGPHVQRCERENDLATLSTFSAASPHKGTGRANLHKIQVTGLTSCTTSSISSARVGKDLVFTECNVAQRSLNRARTNAVRQSD
jgi:hypothetical protein